MPADDNYDCLEETHWNYRKPISDKPQKFKGLIYGEIKLNILMKKINLLGTCGTAVIFNHMQQKDRQKIITCA